MKRHMASLNVLPPIMIGIVGCPGEVWLRINWTVSRMLSYATVINPERPDDVGLIDLHTFEETLRGHVHTQIIYQ